jgi:hypothetical protein
VKSSAAAAGALAMLFGMVAVLAFREPVKPRAKPAQPAASARADADAEPSQRVALGGATRSPAGVRVEPAQAAGGGVDPKWSRTNRDGIAALDAGDLSRAVALFEQCQQAVPGEKVFRQNLAEALARLASELWDRGGTAGQGEAIERMARAAGLWPEREDLQKRLAQMRALAQSEQGNWSESSGHFDLSYDGAREDLAFRTTDVFDALETAYLDLTEQFGIDPVAGGRARIRVVLYRREGFHGATGIGHWAGGLYDGSIRVPLEDLGKERETLRRVLRHELVHAFVHESGGRSVPGWLNEGLAQLLEVPDPAQQARALDAARRRVRGAALVPLERLEGSLGAAGDDEAIGRAYAQSLLFLDFVSREHGERVPFEMVAGCKEPGGPAAAFERRTGLALATAFEDFGARVR